MPSYFLSCRTESRHLSLLTARDFSITLRSARDERLFQIRKQRRMRFLIGECFRSLFAFFHDEFVERRIDGERIIAGETGEAKSIPRLSSCLHHAFEIEITKTVHTEIIADFFHRHLIGVQLFRIRTIVAVMTTKPVCPTAYPNMHFLRARLAHAHNALA